MKKRFGPILLIALLTLASSAFAQEPAIPFEGALDAAAISQPSLDGILDRSLLVGNGDINALLYSDSGNILMRLTKNDVWDARLDTSEDPPLLPIRRIKELAKGDWLKDGEFGGGWLAPDGTPHKGGNSWERPYPCPLPCATLQIGQLPKIAIWTEIRAQGDKNASEWTTGTRSMRIEGKEGASCGYAYGPIDVATSDYPRIRARLSGSANARYFIEALDAEGRSVASSGWVDSPAESAECVVEMPPGRQARSLALYAWTKDGREAANRFEAIAFEGSAGAIAVDLAAKPARNYPCRLDLRRAVAKAHGENPDVLAPAVVRALADRNVFYIASPQPIQLIPANLPNLPKPEVGRFEDGVEYLVHSLPSDPDWPGMRYAVALGKDRWRYAVAIVTSHEAENVLEEAARLVRDTLREEDQALVARHEAQWREFWSASGIDIADTYLRDVWYRNLYFLRCISKPGVEAPGLFASLTEDGLPAWHGGHTTNYNAEQTFWTSFPTNHVELSEPYEQLVSNYLPRARWLCKQLYETEGAYYPHNLFNFEPPNPEQCKSPIGRQQFYVTWSYTIGVSGFTIQNLWLRYKYQPDRDYLEQTAYPAVRDVATFYANFVDSCEAGEGGKVVLAPSVSPEHWGWTHKFERNRNCAFDIAFARYTLRAAIEGAETLGRDAELAGRWHGAIERLPAYPTTEGDAPVVVDVEGAPPIEYNISVPTVPVFPGNDVTWFSPEEEKRLFVRTIDQVKWNGNNSAVMVPVARARLSMPGAAQFMHETFKARQRPNGTLTLSVLGADFNNYGHYTEQFAASMAVSELLIQSVGDIIRLFPAWPESQSASFRNLRAQGGFLVSARQTEKGLVRPVQVVSSAGGRLRMLSPWPAVRVLRQSQDALAEMPPLDARGIFEIDTLPGEQIVLMENVKQ